MNQWEDDTWTKEPLRIIWGLWESHDNKFSVSNKNSYTNIWRKDQLYFFTIHSATSNKDFSQILFVHYVVVYMQNPHMPGSHWSMTPQRSSYMSTKYFRWPSQTRSIQKKKKKIKQWPINEINHRKSSQEKECLFKWYSLDTQCRKCPICPGTSVSSLLIAHPHYSHCMSRWIRKESP